MRKIGATVARMLAGGLVAVSLVAYAQAGPPTLPPSPVITNTPLTPEQLAAQQALLQAAEIARLTTNFAPWVISPVLMPDGSPQSFQAINNHRVAACLGLSQTITPVREQDRVAVRAFLLTNSTGLKDRWASSSGNTYLIDHIEHGRAFIKGSFNVESAETIGVQKLWPGGCSGLNLTASNVVLGQWDTGDVLTTHIEFTNGGRAALLDGSTRYGVANHATHVAGTLAAWGLDPNAKGIAPRAKVRESYYQNDFVEMPLQAATNDLKVSNHSYGYYAGWYRDSGGAWHWAGDPSISTNWDWYFGFYDGVALTNDLIIYTAQTYLPVFGAGNGNETNGINLAEPPYGHIEDSTGQISYVYRPLNNSRGGFYTLTSYALSKNDLSVGAVNQNTNGYSGTNSMNIAYFSSRGPTADGRIKPDLVADGVNVYSTWATASNAYSLDSGTSMAAPAVTGALGLICALYDQLYPTNAPLLFDRAPLASTLKGLVIHTADQLGNTAGPSFTYGWGLIDPVAAASLITNNYASGSLAFVKEIQLVDQDSIQFPVVLTNNAPFKATIVWTDPPGRPTVPALEPTNHMLVNDLDLRVIAPNGATNFPWIMNRNSPTNAATTGDNCVDNVEQVSIPRPADGIYLVKVTHKSSLIDNLGRTNYQNVSIILSGNLAMPPILPHITDVCSFPVSGIVAFKWAAEVGRVYQVQARSDVGSGTWQNVGGELSATKTNIAFTTSISNSSQFYRIVQLR